MSIIIQGLAILLMLAILSSLIIVHECGHFLVARFFGFQTPVFGFGLPFGPTWTIGKAWGTEFKIHACLLGGYVAIPELGDESEITQENLGTDLKPFRKFPIWQRALVAFAGVGFNIIFAYVIMVVMLFSIGDPIQTTQVEKFVAQNPIAQNAGVKPDDILVAVNDRLISSPTDAVSVLGNYKSKPVTLHLLRDGKPVDITLTPNENGKVGMYLEPIGKVKYRKLDESFGAICLLGLERTYDMSGQMVQAIGQMVGNLMPHTGANGAMTSPKGSWQDIHGILAVVKIGADIAKQDMRQLFLFTILISLDLAIFNLVPWPALDGGHLAFMVFEAIMGRPLGPETQGHIVKWGFVSLFALVCLVMFNDVSALLTGKLDLKHNSKTQINHGSDK